MRGRTVASADTSLW